MAANLSIAVVRLGIAVAAPVRVEMLSVLKPSALDVTAVKFIFWFRSKRLLSLESSPSCRTVVSLELAARDPSSNYRLLNSEVFAIRSNSDRSAENSSCSVALSVLPTVPVAD